ncbi:MAG TPA: ABC transporter permease [Verrucomicrobiae bacterium]|nr:ABC transporter permease [Verrucomicrobiae bacterium]
MSVKGTSLLLAEARESFAMAMGALVAHKLRAALTLLGVVVGVFSIIVAMTAMRVLQKSIETNLSGLGAHTFTVDKWPAVSFEGPKGWEKYRRRKPLTLQQEKLVQERATLAAAVGAELRFWYGEASSPFGKTDPDTTLVGMTPEVLACRNWEIAEGRGFLASDMENARYVCVLGNKLAKKLFPRGSALGQKIKLNGINYGVVGVLENTGSMGGEEQDHIVAVPITTGINPYTSLWSLTIYVQTQGQATYDDTVEQVRGLLRAARRVSPGQEDDFEISSNDSVIKIFRNMTFAIRVGVAVVSSIALLAAGIGIMNIMLVSVTERTREIGIRRAVGARKRNIMAQFIMEAVVLCEVGGFIGVVLGVLGGNATALFLKLTPVIPVDWAIIGLVICSAVGIIFGTYPAFKAANLDPIESLRYE